MGDRYESMKDQELYLPETEKTVDSFEFMGSKYGSIPEERNANIEL